MSHCEVPNWNLRQEQVEGEEGNRSSHVHTQQNHTTISTSLLVPISNSNDEVKELKWKNGQLSTNGPGGLLPSTQTKPRWVSRTGDTLESIVHQATCQIIQDPNVTTYQSQTPATISSIMASSGGKWSESSGQVPVPTGSMRKRIRSDSGYTGGRNFSSGSSMQEEQYGGAGPSACGSGSATFCRENDTTMMTWASFDSPQSLKNKSTDEDSACQNGLENPDEDRETKEQSGRSNSTRRSRSAAIHNQSERKRRDKINEKMKALQKLVPNASKTDKASMLDEVIDYLKQLQAQVQMMSSVRNISPQMMFSLGMQQLQMSLLARMGIMGGVGLGMGLGMLDMSSLARTNPQSLPPLIHSSPLAAAAAAPPFVPPPFMVPPPMIAPARGNLAAPVPTSTAPPLPMADPYCALLAQSMNMELYNKMATQYSQQVNPTQAATNPSQSSHLQGD
ncbi:hypothetical protein UlMin_008347 [Ulmus minor]